MNQQNPPSTIRNRDQEGSVAMNSIANDVARARIRDLRADAQAGSRARLGRPCHDVLRTYARWTPTASPERRRLPTPAVVR